MLNFVITYYGGNEQSSLEEGDGSNREIESMGHRSWGYHWYIQDLYYRFQALSRQVALKTILIPIL